MLLMLLIPGFELSVFELTVPDLYKQHKIGISINYFFPFISLVEIILVTYKFHGKCYVII